MYFSYDFSKNFKHRRMKTVKFYPLSVITVLVLNIERSIETLRIGVHRHFV